MTTAVRDSSSDVAVPGTGFTKAHQLFRESVRRFIDQEINPYVDEWEEAEIFPAHDLFKKAGDLGLLGLSYPEEYGGAGADYWYNMALAEELARINCGGIPMAIGVQTDMATPALQSVRLARAEEEVSANRPFAATRSARSPSPNREPARTWPSIRTKAERDGDNYVINGSKMYHHQRRPGRLDLPAGAHLAGHELQGHVADRRADRRAGLLGQQEAQEDGQLVQRHGRAGVRQRAACRCRNRIGEEGHGLHLSDAAVPERTARQLLWARPPARTRSSR